MNLTRYCLLNIVYCLSKIAFLFWKSFVTVKDKINHEEVVLYNISIIYRIQNIGFFSFVEYLCRIARFMLSRRGGTLRSTFWVETKNSWLDFSGVRFCGELLSYLLNMVKLLLRDRSSKNPHYWSKKHIFLKIMFLIQWVTLNLMYKILTKFPWNPILEILIKIRNCVGSSLYAWVFFKIFRRKFECFII